MEFTAAQIAKRKSNKEYYERVRSRLEQVERLPVVKVQPQANEPQEGLTPAQISRRRANATYHARIRARLALADYTPLQRGRKSKPQAEVCST